MGSNWANYLRGIASLSPFGRIADNRRRPTNGDGFADDGAALRQDWSHVGGDIQHAVRKFESSPLI